MADCYSSAASAPIHALANSLLGEPSFTSKNSARSHPALHPSHLHRQQSLFPRTSSSQQRQQQQQQHKHKLISPDAFEHAWSSVAAPSHGCRTEHDRFFAINEPSNYTEAFHLNQKTSSLQRQNQHQHYYPDPNLIASWDHAVQDTANKGLWEQSAGLGKPPPDSFMAEFESFQYTTAPATSSSSHPDSWANELEAQERMERLQIAQVAEADEDDDDEEDEFREEWSNDHFTQAYINSHQSQFQKIQENEQLKEAQLQEEKERQKRSTGCTYPLAHMASSSAVAGAYPATRSSTIGINDSKPRLRVPGLENDANAAPLFCMDEYAQFAWDNSSASSPLQQQQQQPPKPVHAQDRFLSLVNDLHMAGQIYYPGASLSTLPDLASDAHNQSPSNGWAQEFAVETELSARIQRHLGAEWSWEKLFGKDPRKAAERAQRILEQRQHQQTATTSTQESFSGQGANVLLSVKEQSEHDRLKAVALSRLQAVFSHLSSAAPPPLPPSIPTSYPTTILS
ncbi:hypothetical protein BG004_007617 [Podila humilis]|nr:hypothetical protein BG004_007617 [Podila humilis]